MDPDPQFLNADPWIRIRIIWMQIRNTGHNQTIGIDMCQKDLQCTYIVQYVTRYGAIYISRNRKVMALAAK